MFCKKNVRALGVFGVAKRRSKSGAFDLRWSPHRLLAARLQTRIRAGPVTTVAVPDSANLRGTRPMTIRLFSAFLLVLCLSAGVSAQDAGTTHDEIRALRDDMVDAVNKADVDRLLVHLTRDCVVTFENAEVARGHDGVRAYYEKMMKGPGAIVAEYHTTVAVDELTTLYGDDTGVAAGKAEDQFKLSSGMTFALSSRWTATLVKQDGTWYVAAFHASANMFDNPILDKMKGTMYIVGLFAFIMGILVGVLAMMFVRRKKRTA
jgi:uncharacterized protein (TIGR02246 family)